MMLTTSGLACCLLGTCHLNICKCEVRGREEREIGRGRLVGDRVKSGQGLYMDEGATVRAKRVPVPHVMQQVVYGIATSFKRATVPCTTRSRGCKLATLLVDFMESDGAHADYRDSAAWIRDSATAESKLRCEKEQKRSVWIER